MVDQKTYSVAVRSFVGERLMRKKHLRDYLYLYPLSWQRTIARKLTSTIFESNEIMVDINRIAKKHGYGKKLFLLDIGRWFENG